MPSYFHSFGMTPNYIVFVEQPMAFNFLEIGTGRLTGMSVLDSLHYYNEYKVCSVISKIGINFNIILLILINLNTVHINTDSLFVQI